MPVEPAWSWCATSSAAAPTVWGWSRLEEELKAQRRPATTATMIALALNRLGVRRAEVPGSFPLGLAQELTRRGLRLSAVPGAFWPQRQRKRPAEIHAIERAQRAAESGIQAGIEALRACSIGRDGYLRRGGRRFSVEDLRTAVNTAVMARGGVPAHTICAPGDQAVDPHEEGHGPLRAHTPIVIDVFPRSESSGYWGDITRTVVRGRASEKLRELYAAVRAGQKLGCQRVRHGAQGERIHREIQDLFKSRGFATRMVAGRLEGFSHGTGHGLGLEIHEPPYISHSPHVLQAGHVVTVEPGLYYSGLGGVRIEDLLVVTRTGARNLTRLPKILEIG